ncbi:DUF1573 domain-containing protein [Pontibacter qinzhouensis]|uniref:DUF1573 domain-containing protein n=1 Tax=Pontibacter qinzhouensis TaxID=2603253 RepID=A0A5C8KFR5_9BACT|nr:DUF1573 domain-containing protein [Pontibacter qinzhouensis]TXK52892.1 DUF1573 domain-containing protein [Pontibacter qinzhouensis]
MKKNLFFSLSLAVALLATSCDQSNTGDNATAREATATTEQAPATIDNPNVVSSENEAAPSGNGAVIAFEEKEHNFGTIKQGEVVNHTFKFTNTGTTPLVIESASATCGCTVPQPPKDPIAPGQSGEIKVQFNSTGKSGQQQPVITVRANTEPNIVQLSLKGTVEGTYPTAGAEGPIRQN